MPFEIERKFLLCGDGWRENAVGKHYAQSYLSSHPGMTVRARMIEDTGYLTIKGPVIDGKRLEFEYEIPAEDAKTMCQELAVSSVVEKTRYKVDFAGNVWEIDVFAGDNEGLLMAEVELESIDQPIKIPPWIGREVTNDSRYYNSYLAKCPFKDWADE